jgi:uracil-DNA glycosylase
MKLYNLAKGCAECRICEGAAYQTPPVLYAGHGTSPIIAIGQNPGEIKDSDMARQRWLDIFNNLSDDNVSKFMPVWYMWDFYDSPGYKRLSQVFGKGWLMDGQIMWTNAVRCRTEGNATPSKEMLKTCKTWTEQLLEDRKAIIMVGGAARHQIMREEVKKLDWGVPKRHPSLGLILAIKHYSAWKGDDVKTYRKAVKKLKEAI